MKNLILILFLLFNLNVYSQQGLYVSTNIGVTLDLNLSYSNDEISFIRPTFGTGLSWNTDSAAEEYNERFIFTYFIKYDWKVWEKQNDKDWTSEIYISPLWLNGSISHNGKYNTPISLGFSAKSYKFRFSIEGSLYKNGLLFSLQTFYKII